MLIKLLLGLIAGQLLLPAAGFALSGVALRASGSRQCTVKAYANLATRASRSPDLLSLSAQQLSTAETTNAEVAWTQSASGDNALLTAIAVSQIADAGDWGRGHRERDGGRRKRPRCLHAAHWVTLLLGAGEQCQQGGYIYISEHCIYGAQCQKGG